MEEMIQIMTEHGVIVPAVAIAFGCSIPIVHAIAGGIRGSIVGRAREEARREIAAYVAEGSMTPEDAERILNAGKSSEKKRSCC